MTLPASNATSSDGPRSLSEPLPRPAPASAPRPPSPAPAAEPRSTKDDLDLARRLSRSLRGEAPGASSAGQAAPPFARFGVAPHGPRAMGIGSEGWKRLLAEVTALTHAQQAFAIDESGLLVAGVGVERDEAEGVGSRLVVAFEHLDQAAQRVCRSVSVDLGGTTLTGFRGGSGAGGVVTLVVRTAGTMPDATRAAVMGLLQPAERPRPSPPRAP